MDPQELQEQSEKAKHRGEKEIGLTTAIVAVLLAVATMMSHRTHTETIKVQTKVNDAYGYYQAKHSRAYEFGMIAELATLLPNGRPLAVQHLSKSAEEECGLPREKNCDSPNLKDSAILKQLKDDLKNSQSVDAAATRADGLEAQSSRLESANLSPSSGSSKLQESKLVDPKPENAQAQESKSGGSGNENEPAPRRTRSESGSGSKEGAVKILETARDLEKETTQLTTRANFFDGSELFLEVSIVLCSISFVADDKLYWRLSFISTFAGLCVMLWAFLM
ncbi:MAG TPA: DUF4337 family protein [Candidatus Angelobacter sp.]|nr:DUF4337 family protein [Candidatus Angelobacter sp.]